MSAPVQPLPRLIPVGLIDPPELASRTDMDPERMDLLVASIRATGFWSVLVVVAIGERYRVVAGHRRSIAAKRAGLVAVPCFVYDSESAALDAIQFAENARRDDLSVTDEAIWFGMLLGKYPEQGTDGVAARVGESRAYVEGRLALLTGCERVFAALAAKEIPIGVAQELNKCTEDAHRFMLLDQSVRGGATVGLVRAWVQEWRLVHLPASPGAAAAPVADAPSAVVMDDYFVCRICGERHHPQNMRPLNGHDYCWQSVIDPSTGLLLSKSDYVRFPRTREDALRLTQRLVERFPELAE